MLPARALALAAACLAFGLAHAQSGPTVDFALSADHQARAESVLKAAGPGSVMLGRNASSPILTVRVPQARAARAEAMLALTGFTILRKEDSASGQPEMHSLRGIEKLSRKVAASRASGKRPGYLEALKHHIKMRAYPFDRVDYDYIRMEEIKARNLPDKYMPPPPGQLSPGTWTFLGPRNLDIPYRTFYGQPPLGGRTNALAYTPGNSNIIYAGAASGGLWKSTDNGVNWTVLSNSWPAQTVNCILMLSANEIMVGLGDLHGNINYGAGIMRSTDGGATWNQIGAATLGSNIGVSHLMEVPGTSGNTLLATTSGGPAFYGGIYRSTDRGVTWTRVENTGNLTWTGLSMSIAGTGGARTVYASAGGWGTHRLYKSTDLGQNWATVDIPALGGIAGEFRWSSSVAASKVAADRVFFMSPTDRIVLQSNDAGATWTSITSGIPTAYGSDANYNWSQYYYNYNLETSTVPLAGGGTTDALYVSNIDLAVFSPAFGSGTARWKTIGGPTWSGSASVLHNDQHSFAVDPANPHNMLVGCDGGVYRLAFNTSNSTYTVTPLNRHMGTHQFYHMAAHPTNIDYVLGGTQDNASPVSKGDLTNWDNVGGGDGGYSFIHPTNPNIQYTSSQFLAVARTTNGWTSFSYISPNWPGDERPGFIAPMELSEANPDRLYGGTNYLHMWDNSTGAWTTRLGATELAPDPTSITAIETNPSNAQIIYVGTEGGLLWRSANAGSTWTRIDNAGLPDRPIREINSHPTSPNSILVALGGSASGRLFSCTNTASATPSWVNSSGGVSAPLPDVTTNSIVRDPSNPTTTWWVGNDLGVYFTEDSGATWQDATRALGLPIVIVNKLDLGKDNRYLYAGTFGRGIWRLDLTPPANSISGLTLSPTTIIRGGTGKSTATISFAQALTAAATVSIANNGAVGGLTFPSSVNAASGATSATFEIGSQSATGAGTVRFTVSHPDFGSRTADLTVRNPRANSLSFNPTTVAGGNSTIATVGLEAPAPPGGLTVNLVSANTSFVTNGSVSLPAGFSSGTTSLGTGLTTISRNINVTLQGTSVTTALNIRPPRIKSVTFAKTDYGGGSGTPIVGVVELDGRAPAGGVVINLSSSVPSLVSVPATVTVPYNQFAVTFAATHSATTGARTVLITGQHTVESVSFSKQGFVVIRPSYVQSLTLSPQGVLGGQASVARITLNAPAPAGGLSVGLSASDRTYISMQNSILVPAGQTSVIFNVITRLPPTDQTTVITAATNAEARSRTLNINAIAPTLLTVAPNPLLSGQAGTATVTLNANAPTGGIQLSIIRSNQTLLTAPTTVTVPAGSKTATFAVSAGTVTTRTSVTLTVIYKNAGTSRAVVIDP